MAKLIISSVEEIQYMTQLLKLQEMMPDIQILIETDRTIPRPLLAFASDAGREFREFLNREQNKSIQTLDNNITKP
jgi:hypothetical protein